MIIDIKNKNKYFSYLHQYKRIIDFFIYHFCEKKMDSNKIKKEKEEESHIIIKRGNQTFLSCCCFELNIGLAFTYLYVISSSGINIINRIVFHNYEFNFNFTYSFLQQFAALLLFTLFRNNETLKKNVGELSFSDFNKFKCYYISFSIISIVNTLMGFYGNQLVKNISMFFSLKKFTVVMLLMVDLFLSKKKISCVTIACIFMMTVGSLLVGMDAFSNDYWGYILVFISDVVQIVYSKLIEVFRNYSGVSSLKLLIYNCYLSIPILIVGALVTNEHNKIYIYLQNEKLGNDGTIYGLGIYLFLGCLCCVILLSSFFISNEKSSSLITNLLTNTKSVLISVIMYFFDKSKNKLSLIILTGLIMSTIGAIFINAESLLNNVSIKKSNNGKNKSKDNKEEEEFEEKETNETELIEVNDDEKSV